MNKKVYRGIVSVTLVMALVLSGTPALAAEAGLVTNAVKQELSRKVIDAVQPSVPFQITPSMIEWDLRHPKMHLIIRGPDGPVEVFMDVTNYGQPEFAAVALRLRRNNPSGFRYTIMQDYLADEGCFLDKSKIEKERFRPLVATESVDVVSKKDELVQFGKGAFVMVRDGANHVMVDSPSIPQEKVEQITRSLLPVVADLPQPSLEAATKEYVRNVLRLDEASESDTPTASLEQFRMETGALMSIFRMIVERDKLAPGSKVPLTDLLKYLPSNLRLVKTKADVLGNPYHEQWIVGPNADLKVFPSDPKTDQFFGFKAPGEPSPH